MLWRSFIIFPLSLLVIWPIGCGTVQTSNWYGFTDSLGTGSEVRPAQSLYNWRGEIEVHLTKAADPAWDPRAPQLYPYAGILMQFKPSGKPVDMVSATGLAVEYRLEGNVSLMLMQEGMPAGREYRVDLPPQRDFARVYFAWDAFQQPSWVTAPTPKDLSRVVGIAFLNRSKQRSTAHLTVRKVSFPGLVKGHFITGLP